MDSRDLSVLPYKDSAIDRYANSAIKGSGGTILTHNEPLCIEVRLAFATLPVRFHIFREPHLRTKGSNPVLVGLATGGDLLRPHI